MKTLCFIAIIFAAATAADAAEEPIHFAEDLQMSLLHPMSLNTSKGSLFEYAVRNVIRNTPINDAINAEHIIYYYHLQMLYIDLMWIYNWEDIYQKSIWPSILQLPSNAVQYFYSTDVFYGYTEMGIRRTLDSHRLKCDMCIPMYTCNANFLLNHYTNRKLNPSFDNFYTPTRELMEEKFWYFYNKNITKPNLPLFIPTNLSSKPLDEQYACSTAILTTTKEHDELK